MIASRTRIEMIWEEDVKTVPLDCSALHTRVDARCTRRASMPTLDIRASAPVLGFGKPPPLLVTYCTSSLLHPGLAYNPHLEAQQTLPAIL